MDGVTTVPDSGTPHSPELIFEAEDGDLCRCACGEQGFDFNRGRDWYAEHLASVQPTPKTIELPDTLWDRAQGGGTPLLDKLAALTDDEWAELTHRMSKHFTRELKRRGWVVIRETDL